jgi:hypothetical protein
LNKVFFRRVKAQFSSLVTLKGLSDISALYEKIHIFIRRAGHGHDLEFLDGCLGIVPGISQDVCTGFTLDEYHPLSSPSYGDAPDPVVEYARG